MLWQISHFYLRYHEKQFGLKGHYAHDASAISYVIDPEFFKLRKGPIRVITTGDEQGMALLKIDNKKSYYDQWSNITFQNLAIEVKSHGFLYLYRDTLIRYWKIDDD